MAGTANGLDLLEATITMPRVGAWTADVVVEGETNQLAAGVTLQVAGATFFGTSRRVRSFAGRTEARIVGGAGKLANEIPAKYYVDTSLLLPLSEALAVAGETLSPTSDEAVTGRHLARWTRHAGPAVDAVRALVDEAGAVWRVLPDGTVWVGTETWPLVDPLGEVLDEDGAEGGVVFAPERLGTLRPGVTWLERRVSHVTHRLTPKLLRTEVLFERVDETKPRVRGALESLIDRRVAHTLFHGLYAATVVAQNAGKLEVKVDDPRLPELTQVEIRHAAGLKVDGDVSGRRIAIAFENGDPKKPIAVGWAEGGSAKFGTLLLTVAGPAAGTPGILLSANFFEPTTAGDAALAVALAGIAASAGSLAAVPPTGLPITTSTLKLV